MKLNLEKIGKKNICLIGLMGSGKSIIGKLLSKDLNLLHFDSDSMIEKKLKKTVSRIFLDHGEEYFRLTEEEMIISMLKKKKCVISLGGGAILSKKIRECLKKKSLTIFLDVSIEILYERLKNSKKRPLLKNNNIKSKLNNLYEERKKYYKKADLVISNTKNISEVITKIKTNLIKYEKNYNKN